MNSAEYNTHHGVSVCLLLFFSSFLNSVVGCGLQVESLQKEIAPNLGSDYQVIWELNPTSKQTVLLQLHDSLIDQK